MVVAKEADPRLAGLTSTSVTGVWRLLLYLQAVCQWAHEQLWAKFRAEVDEIVARAAVGTAEWYVDQLLGFQLGDTLRVIDNVVRYATEDESKRIITRATARVASDGKLFLKVAADGATPGTLKPLTTSQLTQATAYVRRRGFAGVRFELASRQADRISIEATLFYDGLLSLEGDEGLRARVAAALDTALADLPFDGALLQSRLEDAMQAVPGVKDVAIANIITRSGLITYLATRPGRWDTQAGYIIQDDTPGATFADTLIFEPYV